MSKQSIKYETSTQKQKQTKVTVYVYSIGKAPAASLYYSFWYFQVHYIVSKNISAQSTSLSQPN